MDNSLVNESKETQKDPLPEESKSDCPLSKKVKPDASLTEEEKPEKQQDSLQLALQMLASPPESACEEVMNKWKEFGVLSIEEIRKHSEVEEGEGFTFGEKRIDGHWKYIG